MIDGVDESLEFTAPGDGKSAGGNASSVAVAGSENEDLSKELARALKREPLEQVTCRRVGDHHYRCNWWTPQATAAYDNPSMLGSLVTTSRISKSQFVHATKTGRKLTVTVITR